MKTELRFGMSLLILLAGIISFAVAQEEFKPSVDFKGSRFAAGYLDSGNDGSFPAGSFQMPDAKLRFNWSMNPDITVVTRMSLNDASFKDVDYLYLEYRNLLATAIPSMKNSPFNPIVRLGRFKADFGEEVLSNNPVDGVLISNSAANVDGKDEGLQLLGTISKEYLGVPMKWSLSITNGNEGTGADNEQAKAFCAKIGIHPVPNIYVTASYYNSGELGDTGSGAKKAELSYAKLADAPISATKWSRNMTEIDLRYDFQSVQDKLFCPDAPAWCGGMGYIRMAYGQFTDDGKDTAAPIVNVVDRKGTYYFVEGVYNATKEIYLGIRQSNIEFDKGTVFASLNSVDANKYTRTSFGAGYRLSGNTHIKFEYATNTEDVPTTAQEPENNQISTLITTKF